MSQKIFYIHKWKEGITSFFKPDKYKLALFCIIVFIAAISAITDGGMPGFSLIEFFLPAAIILLPLQILVFAIDPKLRIFDIFYFIAKPNSFVSFGLALFYVYALVCFVAISVNYLRKRFSTVSIIMPMAVFFILSISVLGWAHLTGKISFENIVKLTKILTASLFSAYIFTFIALVALLLVKRFLTLLTIKKVAIVLGVIVIYFAIFFPVFQGNILPTYLNEKEKEIALFAIREIISQLDLQGNSILQYEVKNLTHSNECWIANISTKTYFGKPYYEMVAKIEEQDGELWTCNKEGDYWLEITNECSFDPNCN